jgi:DNA repair exonuclease SbcCD nuclease subunit
MAKHLVTGDWQWDCYENYSTLLPSGLTSRLSDMVACWKWIEGVALERKCEGIIAVGDIFDSRTTIDLSVLDQACRAVHGSVRAGLKVRFIPGNHDSYLKSSLINSLQVFLGHCEVYEEPTVMGKLGFLPWTDDQKAFKNAVDLLRKGGAQYLFAHVLVYGAVHKKAGGVPLSWLQPEKFKRVLLGDVHEPVELESNACYVGAPMQFDYGDAGGSRGVRILDDVSGKLEWVENPLSPRFHIITHPKQVHLVNEGDFARIKIDDPVEAAKAEAALRTVTAWVESTAVVLSETPPRLDVRSSLSHEEALTKYLAFKDCENAEYLLTVGLDIIERAKG